MNKDLKILTVILALVLVVALAFTILLLGSTEPEKVPEQTQGTSAAPETTAETTYVTTQPTTVQTTAPTTEATTAPTEETTEPTVPETTKKPTSNTPATKPPKPTTEPVKTLSFPYQIPGTSLVIQKLDSYDGPFLEDGSDRDISGVCAMVVKNAGSKAVEYAKITLTQGDRTLTFTVSGLRAGASTVAQEAKAAAYSKEKYNECTAEVAELSSFEMSSDAVKVTENEDGTLNVTNLTQQTIPCVRVFYKFCMTPGSIYVGGITYTAKLTDLAPGQTQQVTASHYASGFSEVIMVRTYDNAD